jgi:hypothetical protein
MPVCLEESGDEGYETLVSGLWPVSVTRITSCTGLEGFQWKPSCQRGCKAGLLSM